MEKIKYGIIGIGKMGSAHAIQLKMGRDKNGQLVAVCDISEARREWAKKNLGGVAVYENYMDLLESKTVDSVIVATPHYLHPVIVTEALNRGINALSEKPAGVFTKSVRVLNELAETKKDTIFAIMYNQRTNVLYKKAKEIIESGELGEMRRINWIITSWYRPQAYFDQGGWRGTWSGEGGGVLINQCPHQLDLFQWLGGMPCKVRANVKVGVNRNINVENDVTAYFEYPNGATGVFVTSTHDAPGSNRLEITFDGGRIIVENNKLSYTKLAELEPDFSARNTKFMGSPAMKKKIIKQNPLIALLDSGVSQHIRVIRAFSKAVQEKNPDLLVAKGVEGINGLTLSNSIYLSSWLDREIVLPIDEDLFISELEKRKEEEKVNSKK